MVDLPEEDVILLVGGPGSGTLMFTQTGTSQQKARTFTQTGTSLQSWTQAGTPQRDPT